MQRWIRALVAIMLALGGAFVGVTAASAATVPSVVPTAASDLTACEQADLGYVPDTPCQILVDGAAQCVKDVPYVAYSATLEGSTATTTTITFVNPSGPDVVLSGQPLSGQVPWPGATFDGEGNATDWPGWTQLSSGLWVTGDEYDWSIPTVQVVFDSGPSATTSVSYVECGAPENDASTVTTVDNPVATPVLSETGATVAPLLAVAGGLVVAGLLALVLTRRRRAAQH